MILLVGAELNLSDHPLYSGQIWTALDLDTDAVKNKATKSNKIGGIRSNVKFFLNSYKYCASFFF
jgi:hypothetical protein